MSDPTVVVFDLGNVFVRWNPRNFFKEVFKDDAKMEWFLANVCTSEWNLSLDAGVTYQDATSQLKAKFPDWATYIDQYESGWQHMFAGAIEDTVAVQKELKTKNVPVYAITNWSDEKFPLACELFPFFNDFAGVVVSGKEKLIKPDPKIFQLFLQRYGFAASQCLFIDDVEVNAKAAEKLGFRAHVYQTSPGLRRFLREQGVL